jgi:hypothetical protein
MASYSKLLLGALLLGLAAPAPADAARHCNCGPRKAKVVRAVAVAKVAAPQPWKPWNVDIVTAGDPEDRITRKRKDPFWVLDFMPAVGQNRPITP